MGLRHFPGVRVPIPVGHSPLPRRRRRRLVVWQPQLGLPDSSASSGNLLKSAQKSKPHSPPPIIRTMWPPHLPRSPAPSPSRRQKPQNPPSTSATSTKPAPRRIQQHRSHRRRPSHGSRGPSRNRSANSSARCSHGKGARHRKTRWPADPVRPLRHQTSAPHTASLGTPTPPKPSPSPFTPEPAKNRPKSSHPSSKKLARELERASAGILKVTASITAGARQSHPLRPGPRRPMAGWPLQRHSAPPRCSHSPPNRRKTCHEEVRKTVFRIIRSYLPRSAYTTPAPALPEGTPALDALNSHITRLNWHGSRHHPQPLNENHRILQKTLSPQPPDAFFQHRSAHTGQSQ